MASLQELIAQRKNREYNRPKPLTKEELEEQVTDWCDFYRKNWDIYAKYELGIEALFIFQDYILYLMGVCNVFFLMCGRGLSKSMLSALGAFIQCMLYPNSEVVLTATTIKTAKKMVKNKMENELCNRFSPKLKYLYDMKQIEFKYSDEEIIVNFKFNNSWIKVLPENENSAGERSTFLVFEEVRLAKQNIVNRIFMPMRHARVPDYKLKEQYKNDKRLVERAKIVYLTSTSYTFEWFFDRWRAVLGGYFNPNSKMKYGVFTGDIVTSIHHNLTTQEEFDMVLEDPSYSEEEIKMEYYNEPQGGVEGAFYNMQKIKENSTIEIGFIPPTYEEFLTKYDSDVKNVYRKKDRGEIRAIYVDFASSDTVKSGQENDDTVIGCMCGIPNKQNTKMLRRVEHMETRSGGDKDGTLKRIRELVYFYDADVFIYDNQQTGSDRFQDLTKSFSHPELGIAMNGFGMYDDKSIAKEFCDESRFENLRSKVVDSNCRYISIPVVGSPERNQSFHNVMQSSINSGVISFLMDTTALKRKLEQQDNWFLMSSEEHARRIAGHKQVDKMAVEASELQKEIKGGYIKLSEIAHHTKDKIVATTYANYFFYLLELKMLKGNQEQDSMSDEDLYAIYFG